MARYRVLEKSFHQNHIRDVGDIVEHNGKAGANLQLIAPSKPQPAVTPAKGVEPVLVETLEKLTDDAGDLA